jgi:hypothetical protein
MPLCAFAGEKVPAKPQSRKGKQELSVVYAAISEYLCKTSGFNKKEVVRTARQNFGAGRKLIKIGCL